MCTIGQRVESKQMPYAETQILFPPRALMLDQWQDFAPLDYMRLHVQDDGNTAVNGAHKLGKIGPRYVA